MKTLSVKQPHATLICSGVKRIENRTWKTDYRGRLLIHASGDSWAYPDFAYLPKQWQKKILSDYAETGDWTGAPEAMRRYNDLLYSAYKFYDQDWNKQEPPEQWLKGAVKRYGYFLPSQAVIGECTLVDIFDNLYDANSEFAERGSPYFWKLADAVLYDKPIINVMGRLRLWDFNKAP